jgi:hypothetical protein
MYFDITEAQYLDNYKIRLSFEDGSTGIADLSEYPNADNVFHSFLDIAYFKDFRIEHGTLVWGKGELDIAPETLYVLATGKSVTYRATRSSAI